MKPEVSVIVPIYNVERYLRNCIGSILAQSFKDFELILVNDGSTDNSKEICDSLAKQDSRIKVIHKGNKGVSHSRNQGIAISRGRYICFVDSDDEVEPNYLKELYVQAEKYAADIVVSPIKIINEPLNEISTSPIWKDYNCKINKETISGEIIPSILQGKYNSLLSCCNKLYNSKLFIETNIYFDEARQHGEDARLNCELLKTITSLVFIDIPLYNYFIRKKESLSKVLFEEKYYFIVDNLQYGISLCESYKVPQYIDNVIKDYFFNTIEFMQSLVHANEISVKKKQSILISIMSDDSFQKVLSSPMELSNYYKILKMLARKKQIRLFIFYIKFKSIITKFKGKVCQKSPLLRKSVHRINSTFQK